MSTWAARAIAGTRGWFGHQVYVWCVDKTWRIAYLIGKRDGLGVVRIDRGLRVVDRGNLWHVYGAGFFETLPEVQTE